MRKLASHNKFSNKNGGTRENYQSRHQQKQELDFIELNKMEAIKTAQERLQDKQTKTIERKSQIRATKMRKLNCDTNDFYRKVN